MTAARNVLRRALAAAAALAALALAQGCAGGGLAEALRGGGDAGLSDVQACAVGHDLAAQVFERVSLRRTVLIAPARPGACERHALEHLRRTGFRIAGTGRGGTAFGIAVERTEGGDVAAVAEIGGGLRIARMYTPVATGVRAASAVTVQRLDPDTYLDRGARWE